MADINVKQLSKVIKIDLESLLSQMSAAGLSHKSENDVVSSDDKKVLLKLDKLIIFLCMSFLFHGCSSVKKNENTSSTNEVKYILKIRFGYDLNNYHFCFL